MKKLHVLLMSACLAGPALADTMPPPKHLIREGAAPADVLQAAAVLRDACDGSWPQVRTLSEVDGRSEVTAALCDAATNPRSVGESSLYTGLGIGVALTCLLLILGSVLRAIVVGLWAWRPARRPVNVRNA